MIPADLKIGMYLFDDGKGSIPVYYTVTTQGTPRLKIQPGQMIGQIVDFKSGPSGTLVLFISNEIEKAAPTMDRMQADILNYLTFGYKKLAGIVKFTDLAKNVSDRQIEVQKNAIAIAESKGVSLKNEIKAFTEGAGDIINEAGKNLIPWNLVWIAGAGYVVINWNKFFKPKTI